MRFGGKRSVLVLGLILCAPLAVAGQVRMYAGHAGNAGGNSPGSSPGAFSSVDPATGQVTVIGTPNGGGGGVAGLASDGKEIYAALAIQGAATLVTINPITGTIDRTIGPITMAGGGLCAIGDLAMGANRVLFGFTSNGQNHLCDGNSAGTVVTIDTATAVATAIGRPMEAAYGSNAENVNGGLAVDGTGRLWLSPGWNHPEPGKFFVLDKTTGLIADTLDLSGVYPDFDGANGLAWNPMDGQLYASFEMYGSDPADPRSLWRINPSTGVSQLVADTGFRLHDLVFVGTVSSAPVLGMGSFVLLTLLMTVLGVYTLKRRTFV